MRLFLFVWCFCFFFSNSASISRKMKFKLTDVNTEFSDEATKRGVVGGMSTADLYRDGYQPKCSGNGSVWLPDEQRLVCSLLDNYHKAVRPVAQRNDTLVVNFSFAINQLFDLDDRLQVLTMDVWLEEAWTDEKLRWNPSEFGNVTMINIPSSFLFLPDIVLYNTAADYTKDNKRAVFRAMVLYNGRVFYGFPVKMVSTCNVNPTWFPFDKQVCLLKFGSWTYTESEIDLQPSRPQVDLSRLIPNGKWKVIDVKQKRNSIKYTCCPDSYVDMSYYLVLKRHSGTYMVNIFFSTCMLTTTTMAALVLPFETNEKCNLGISILFSVSLFMVSVHEKLPQSSVHVPMINVYLFTILAVCAISLMLTIGVSRIESSQRIAKIPPLPKWVGRVLKGVRQVRGQSSLDAYTRAVAKYIKRRCFIDQLKALQGYVNRELNELICDRKTEKLAKIERLKRRHEMKLSYRQILVATKDLTVTFAKLVNSFENEIEKAWNLVEWQELVELLNGILFVSFGIITALAFTSTLGLAFVVAPSAEEMANVVAYAS